MLETHAHRPQHFPLEIEHDKLKAQMIGTDVNYLAVPWMFALKKGRVSAGPEYLAVTSVKYNHVGQRSLVLVDFASLQQFAKATARQGAVMTLQKMVDLVCDADADMVAALVRANVQMWQGVVPAKHTVAIPWGFIVIERCDNTEDCLGWRWTLLSDYVPDSFAKLADIMLPHDATNVKANSVQAMLAKLVMAIQKGGMREVPLASVKQEAVNKLVQDNASKLPPKVSVKDEPESKRQKTHMG